MKTTDLIPILLYHLKEGDKYGLELVEACKECSDDKIEIKQPTLYSILKKLEKSHFVSSYWKDSEIGGKRHYFKITENGLAQLETYPPLDELVKLALIDNENENLFSNKTKDKEVELSNKATPSITSFEFTFDSIGEISKENVIKSHENSPALNTDDNKELDLLENIEDSSFDITSRESANIDTKINTSVELEKELELPDIINPETSFIGEETNIQHENESYIQEIENIPDTSSSISFDIDNIKSGEIELPNSVLTINERKVDENNTGNSFDIFDAISYADDGSGEPSKNPLSDAQSPALDINDQISEVVNEEILDINKENTKLFEDELDSFIQDERVSKFTKEKEITPAKKSDNISTEFEDAPPAIQEEKIANNEIEIKFSDYEDFSTSPKILNAKRFAKQSLKKNVLSSMLAFVIILTTIFVSVKTRFTTTYIVCTLLFTLYIVFSLCRFIGYYHSYNLKLISNNISFNKQKILIVRLIIFLIMLITLSLVNFVIIKEPIFKINNLGNFIFPILETSYFLFDYLLILFCFKAK